MKLLLTIAATVVLFTGISVSLAQAETDVQIAIGCTKSIGDDGVKSKFVEVLQDSRCPKGVTCVWEGNARIKIEVSQGKNAKQQFELETNGNMRSADFKGLRITLKDLYPYPDSQNPTNRSDYKATFTVTGI